MLIKTQKVNITSGPLTGFLGIVVSDPNIFNLWHKWVEIEGSVIQRHGAIDTLKLKVHHKQLLGLSPNNNKIDYHVVPRPKENIITFISDQAKILERDNYECQVCQTSFKKNRLQALVALCVYRISTSKGFNFDNSLTLCRIGKYLRRSRKAGSPIYMPSCYDKAKTRINGCAVDGYNHQDFIELINMSNKVSRLICR